MNSQWLAYDWELGGLPAQFHVDMSFQEAFDTLGDFTTLLYASCYSLAAGADAFTPREKKLLDGVLKDCLSAMGNKAVYVGYIDVQAQRRYYFYASDPRLLVPLMNVAEETDRFRMECVKAEEPNRQTYYRLLVPDQAKIQGADNALYIRSLRDRGDDGSAMRRVNLHFYFPSGSARELFSRDAKLMGFAIGRSDYIPERDLPYYLVLHAVSPLTWKAVTDLTTKSIYGAEAYGGALEHFDSAFVPKRSWL